MKDTERLLAEAEAQGHEDRNPTEVTNPNDPSWVEPAKGVTPPAGDDQ